MMNQNNGQEVLNDHIMVSWFIPIQGWDSQHNHTTPKTFYEKFFGRAAKLGNDQYFSSFGVFTSRDLKMIVNYH